MITLFIDTSNSDVSIALYRDHCLIASINEDVKNHHSTVLVGYIDHILKEQNIDPKNITKILVTTGPGSFTGIRIGLAVAKTWGYIFNIPVIEVSSLKMLTFSTNNCDYKIAIIDARNDNFYVGIYDKEYNEIIPEHFCSKEQLLGYMTKYSSNVVVSNKEIINLAFKSKLNMQAIYDYYFDKDPSNIHSLKPNYLKLPAAMEQKK